MTRIPRFAYRHSGVRIASDIELSEWEAFKANVSDAPDVTISVTRDAMPAAVEGHEISFAIPEVGEWKVSGGSAIVVRPDDVANCAELRLFTLGSAWGALGYQRGWAFWHGSAVARQGSAILACGESGAGKSTLAASLVARGSTLVSDDLSRIELATGSALIHPASARLKLWGEVVGALGWQGRVLHPDWVRADKFHCAVPESCAGGDALPLLGIVVLEEGDEPKLERLVGSEALAKVLAATVYRSEFIETLAGWPQQGALAAQILATTPVYRLTRPRDLERLGESAELVESLWQGSPG